MKLASLSPLPIDEALPRLHAALEGIRTVVLSAPPGAGKTTRVPLALLSSSWLTEKKILLLEPRRLAARRAAEYIAGQIGEPVGTTIGFRTRGETRVSPHSRIEVVTEGILTRMFQSEPDLPGTGIVVFDEFHERSIQADLGLALALDVQAHLRNDLRILVMSATLDGISLARILDQAPVVESVGRSYPVTTHYQNFSSDKPMDTRVAETLTRALENEEGDILVFLPGRREIRRVEHLLFERKLPEDVVVHTLHGEASYVSQAAALAPAPVGTRKVILATNVAETSLTIEGIRVIIDSGLVRVARFDARRGMSGLVTVPVSKASADQRRGRAGRLQPGVCYRLWTETEHVGLPEHPQPEMKSADLAPLALDLELWGSPGGEGLRFIDPPPAAHLQQARSVLTMLGALDETGKLTTRGRAMSMLPVHPRLAAMLVESTKLGWGSLACDLAALLEERDLLAGKEDTDIDLGSRLQALKTRRTATRERIIGQSRRLRALLSIAIETEDDRLLGPLLALAYPERVAKRHGAHENRYTMVSGTTAILPRESRLIREEYLAIGDVDGAGAEVRVYLAAPLISEDVKKIFSDRIVTGEEITWDPVEEVVVARRASRLGAITISQQPLDPRSESVAKVLVEGVQKMGVDALPWSREARSLQTRSEWLRLNGFVDAGWPEMSPEALLATADEWLLPFLGGMWRRDQLALLNLGSTLKARFSHRQLRELEELAPPSLKLPSGSRIVLDYGSGAQPILGVRLQELFGQTETPRIAAGRVPVLLQLLSPARRPLAVTQDLRSFWKTVYPEIRTQMRARYPKHFWPEDPLHASPTNRPIKRKP